MTQKARGFPRANLFVEILVGLNKYPRSSD